MTAQASARGIPWWLRVLGAGVALLPLIQLLFSLRGVSGEGGEVIAGLIALSAGPLLWPMLLSVLCWLAGWRRWALGVSILLVLLAFPAYRGFGPTSAALLGLNLLPAALLLATRPRTPDHPV